MNAYDTLPDAVTEIFGAEATAERAYDLLTVDVPVGSWIAALEIARDKLGCTYFDWLSAVDEPGTGFRVCAHVAALEAGAVRRLLVRTTVPHASPSLPTAVEVYAGAAWHERETHEMFGVEFTGHPNLVPLLLPENFEGHPLRKDFVLAARVVKAWPGAKEPGESEHGGPKRRQMLPPGVPDPNEWGPLKGQLPPAPTRPTRAAGAAAADRPARRARTTAGGSASQAEETAPAAPAPRRARTAAEGSASQTPETPATGPAEEGSAGQAGETAPAARRARTAAEGSASQTAAPATPGGGAGAGSGPAPGVGEETTTPAVEAEATAGPASERAAETPGADESTAEAEGPSDQGAPPRPPRRSRSAADGSASQAGPPAGPVRSPRTRSSDAPWHHARPAFEDEPAAAEPVPDTAPAPDAAPDAAPEAEDPTDTPPTPPAHPAGGDPA
ncbi:NADH-quinone oxidoreductase subunit C [Streptomyces sp. NPDC015346]|uniref:NADH-quinone oxidoreductase subunit C n=1 Tax=Streptomyces sp. NPDC015346 TaxID=3364954 RepID=UPI0036FDD919